MIQPFRKTFSGTGRKRKAAPRYPGGQIKHAHRRPEETEQDVLKTATDARVRLFGVSKDEARDPLLGSALGRLKRTRQVSGYQFDAGVRFGRCMSLQGILDDVRPAYGVPVLARLSCASGRDPYERFDPEQAWDATDERRRHEIIATIRRDAADITNTLWEIEGFHPGATYVLNRVVMWDDIAAVGNSERMGGLRVALNALVHLWKLDAGKASRY